jgi:hypothetical protein
VHPPSCGQLQGKAGCPRGQGGEARWTSASTFLGNVLALRHALGDLLYGFVPTVLIAIVIGTIYYAIRLVTLT